MLYAHMLFLQEFLFLKNINNFLTSIKILAYFCLLHGECSPCVYSEGITNLNE